MKIKSEELKDIKGNKLNPFKHIYIKLKRKMSIYNTSKNYTPQITAIKINAKQYFKSMTLQIMIDFQKYIKYYKIKIYYFKRPRKNSFKLKVKMEI